MIFISGFGTSYSIQIAYDMFVPKIVYRMTISGGSWNEWKAFEGVLSHYNRNHGNQESHNTLTKNPDSEE